MSLSIEHVSYQIDGYRILHDITAAAQRGEIVGLIGPNGAGKSTLANILNGFTTPSIGKVRIDERNLVGLSPQRIARLGVARTFQGQHLPWNLTSRACLLSAIATSPSQQSEQDRTAFAHQKAQHAAVQQADIWLKRFGLSEVSGKKARDLSFGQQRLLAVAMACARSSRLLILDEPFVGLKSMALQAMLDVLRTEAPAKVIIVIDHTLSAIREVASRIWFMHRGQLTVFRDYSELAASELFRSNYFGGPQGVLTEYCRPESSDAQNAERSTQRMAGSSRAVLELRGVAAGYENKVVIRSAPVVLHSGEILCVIGTNGSGKSTFLRAIVGVAKLFEGQIIFCGDSVNNLSPDARVRKGMRLLVQDHRLFRTLSLPDNLLLSATAVESPRRLLAVLRPENSGAARGSVARAVENLEDSLPDFAGRAAGTYSGGEQARVALAQLEFGDPKLILLDEPTSGIDGIALQSLMAALHRWKQRGAAVVIVEHALDFVSAVATRVLVAANGELHEVTSDCFQTRQLFDEVVKRLN